MDGTTIDRALTNRIVTIRTKEGFVAGDMLRKGKA